MDILKVYTEEEATVVYEDILMVISSIDSDNRHPVLEYITDSEAEIGFVTSLKLEDVHENVIESKFGVLEDTGLYFRLKAESSNYLGTSECVLKLYRYTNSRSGKRTHYILAKNSTYIIDDCRFIDETFKDTLVVLLDSIVTVKALYNVAVVDRSIISIDDFISDHYYITYNHEYFVERDPNSPLQTLLTGLSTYNSRKYTVDVYRGLGSPIKLNPVLGNDLSTSKYYQSRVATGMFSEELLDEITAQAQSLYVDGEQLYEFKATMLHGSAKRGTVLAIGTADSILEEDCVFNSNSLVVLCSSTLRLTGSTEPDKSIGVLAVNSELTTVELETSINNNSLCIYRSNVKETSITTSIKSIKDCVINNSIISISEDINMLSLVYMEDVRLIDISIDKDESQTIYCAFLHGFGKGTIPIVDKGSTVKSGTYMILSTCSSDDSYKYYRSTAQGLCVVQNNPSKVTPVIIAACNERRLLNLT